MGSRGQGGIEYLLLIGAVILVVAVVVSILPSLIIKPQISCDPITGLRSEILTKVPINNYLYDISDPVVNGLLGLYHLNGDVKDGYRLGGVVKGVYYTHRDGTNYGAIQVSGLWGASGMDFNGDGAYVGIPNLNIYDTNQLTYSVWFKPADGMNRPLIGGYWHTAYSADDGTGAPFLELKSVPSDYNGIYGGFYCDWCGDSYEARSAIDESSLIGNSQWHNAVLTLDTNVSADTVYYSIYLDGNVIGSGNAGQHLYGCHDFNGCINTIAHQQNSNGVDEYFKGALQEVAIWDRALTPAEVLELYLNSFKTCKDGQIV